MIVCVCINKNTTYDKTNFLFVIEYVYAIRLVTTI